MHYDGDVCFKWNTMYMTCCAVGVMFWGSVTIVGLPDILLEQVETRCRYRTHQRPPWKKSLFKSIPWPGRNLKPKSLPQKMGSDKRSQYGGQWSSWITMCVFLVSASPLICSERGWRRKGGRGQQKILIIQQDINIKVPETKRFGERFRCVWS